MKRVGILSITVCIVAIIGCGRNEEAGVNQASGAAGEPLKNLAEDYWRQKLSPEKYRVLREKKTERPFTGKYWNSHEKGIYLCGACGNELFSSDHKFDSGTGWPSFDRPLKKTAVDEHEDRTLWMVRTEVTCGKCGSHLGHVFGDGPRETTGKRYCINSIALEFKEKTD